MLSDSKSTSLRYLGMLLKREGNDKCADCKDFGPRFASINLGVFICQNCAVIHRSIGSHISKVKGVYNSGFQEYELEMLATMGNQKANEHFERHLPAFFERPTTENPRVLREEWIRAKYERCEFTDPLLQQSYISGLKTGTLWKRGKSASDNTKYKRRRFTLTEDRNSLQYYNTDEENARPKLSMPLEQIQIFLTPDKLNNPNGMHLIFDRSGSESPRDATRSLFLWAESSKETVDWVMAVRCSQFRRMQITYPAAHIQDLVRLVCPAILKEGWLDKQGPRANHRYKRRWCIISSDRYLRYYNDPMDAFPRGAVFIGSSEDRYRALEGLPAGVRESNYSFTLETPNRKFYLRTDSITERFNWLDTLSCLINTPLSQREVLNTLT